MKNEDKFEEILKSHVKEIEKEVAIEGEWKGRCKCGHTWIYSVHAIKVKFGSIDLKTDSIWDKCPKCKQVNEMQIENVQKSTTKESKKSSAD